MLLRSMIEIYVNYAWIRLSRPHSRAIRFMRFETLERIQILEELSAHSPDDYAAAVAYFRCERSKLAYLFRGRNKKGKLQWARHWASTTTYAERLRQVLEAQAAGSASGNFLKPLHKWNSSSVHGGPVSVAALFDLSSAGLRTRLVAAPDLTAPAPTLEEPSQLPVLVRQLLHDLGLAVLIHKHRHHHGVLVHVHPDPDDWGR